MAAISSSRRSIILFKSLTSNNPSSNYYYNNKKWISTTIHLNQSWMNKIKGAGDKIKGVFTGQTSSPSSSSNDVTSQSFTLFKFADELKKARKLGTFKQYMVGRSSEATFADAFEKQEAIIRFLGGFDNTGENIQPSQKQEAAKKLKCTIADVENTLAKFTWAKEAQRKIEKLKEEGKPMPKSLGEVQKLMGSTPMDVAQSNMAKSGQISRNALCPCGSKKRYKRCCGA
uniref:protein translocase subunit SecA 1 n=1 Tax=Erigeron canadensis TaxID=72917 RepID=UPI001CB8C7F9|nr:protein translocase subunit SecA 1 [Erigeron canadensis]